MLKNLFKKNRENAKELNKNMQAVEPAEDVLGCQAAADGQEPDAAQAGEGEKVMLCIYIPEGVFDEEELAMAGFNDGSGRYDELYDQLVAEAEVEEEQEVVDLAASRMDGWSLTADAIQYFIGEICGMELSEASESLPSMFAIA